MNWSNAVIKFALAIKVAEGSNPSWNNPGDLTFADGYATLGSANVEGVLKFAHAEDGWNALCHQVYLMLSGLSRVYPLNWTIAQVGMKYSGGDPNWSKNVCAELGVSDKMTLSEFAASLDGE
jgi:hypothetical protein